MPATDGVDDDRAPAAEPVPAVVLCGTDADALGAVASTLSVRAAVFVADLTTDEGAAALREMVEELFAPR